MPWWCGFGRIRGGGLLCFEGQVGYVDALVGDCVRRVFQGVWCRVDCVRVSQARGPFCDLSQHRPQGDIQKAKWNNNLANKRRLCSLPHAHQRERRQASFPIRPSVSAASRGDRCSLRHYTRIRHPITPKSWLFEFRIEGQPDRLSIGDLAR